MTTNLPGELVGRVVKAVDDSKDELIGMLQDLVRIPSENPKLSGGEPGGEAAVQDYLTPKLTALGCQIDRWEPLPGRPDMVGVLKGTGGGKSLVVNGHIDVVPAGDVNDWNYPPYAAEIHDGKVWGRGSVDMKGGVSAQLHAATILHRLGIKLKGDLMIETVIDEETGGPGTRSTIERGYRPDFAVVTEPTNMEIIPVEGGVVWMRVNIPGKAGHSALRYRTVHAGGQGVAVNAIEKAMKLLAAVNELEREWANRKMHPLLPKGITTINPGVIAGGVGYSDTGVPTIMTSVSTLPDYCALELSIKFLPTETIDDVKAQFEDYIHRVCQADSWLRDNPPTFQWGIRGVMFPAVNTPLDHPGVLAMSDAVQAATGKQPPITGFVAVADVAWFAEKDIPCVLFGPGAADSAHSAYENIEIDQLVAGTKSLALMMLSWCGYEA